MEQFFYILFYFIKKKNHLLWLQKEKKSKDNLN